MTTVYYTFCEQLSQAEFRKSVALLPAHMQNRIRKYRRWEDSHAYLYGRLLLKHAVADLGYNCSLEMLKREEYGKPYFNDDSFSFNISHSGKYIVCVISCDEKESIGIDIEEIKPINLNDFTGVLSPREKNIVDSNEKFYTYWTRKEAIIKADGRGLLIPLETMEVIETPVQLGDAQYFFSNIDIDKNYKIHMASLSKIRKIEVKHCLFFSESIEKFQSIIVV